MDVITNEEAELLLELITRDNLLEGEAAEALVHALVDIKESINEVYCEVLPELIQKSRTLTKAEVQDKLWDIREAFRHIDYHMDDSKICDL